ncbi:uncharacterized protein AB675_11174 [Cyphellophora attinorum]|uniref:Uncharacterized protein n=1 Tax=Cyphellophora attinorum TaxID=1664694 RepID=A0A0N1GYF9_9EURO|nr:uncharacterized protein AB675_11174 [Phialophora attinorum]KPI35777.1 hypothetical protein AB675_11174 [Phialophora attinorum]
MSNLARVNRERYLVAETYAKNGDVRECLEICWQMRLQSDLSLYQRAWVNLLIASVIDVQNYPDCDKYPKEVKALVEQIRREVPTLGPKSSSALHYLEAKADELQGQIERLQKEVAEKHSTLVPDNRVFHEETNKTILNDFNKDADEPVDKSIEEKQWTIEGMYTDLGFGYGRNKPVVDPPILHEPILTGDKVMGSFSSEVGGQPSSQPSVFSNKPEGDVQMSDATEVFGSSSPNLVAKTSDSESTESGG